MIDQQTIEGKAEDLLEGDLDPAVRVRLLRDVLRIPPGTGALEEANVELDTSHWVEALEGEQWSDGSWERLHSKNSKSQRTIPTTEYGIERALALGLRPDHPILTKAAGYLANLITGEIDPRDPAEKNDRWPTGVRLFAASSLARMWPMDQVLDPTWDLWAQITDRAFAAGDYDPQAEIEVHRELTGASVKDSYLVLNNKYTLTLLGSRAGALAGETEKNLLDWIWRRPGGIGYLGEQLSSLPERLGAGRFERWFSSMELLSSFPSWRRLAKGPVAWLWEKRSLEGTWDFGSSRGASAVLPLSENWRRPGARSVDWTTRVLILMRRFCVD